MSVSGVINGRPWEHDPLYGGMSPESAERSWRAARPGERSGTAFEGRSSGRAIKGRISSSATLRSKVFPPIRYAVPGYIAAGATILAGKPKLGKSWLMLEVAIAVARGGQCLGNLACDAGSVLYLALEDNERRLQSRMTKLLGISQDWPATLHYAIEWPRADEGGLQDIRDWITTSERPTLVVVDVLAMFRSPRGDRQSLYESDYAAMKGLQQLASETGVAIVAVHHLRKTAADVDPFDKVSGTLGLSGAADSVLILDRDANGTTLYGRGRDIEEIETAISFDKETARWSIVGLAAEVRRTEERSKILSFLLAAGGPVSPHAIALGTGMARNNVDQLLFKMGKDGGHHQSAARTIRPLRPIRPAQ